MRALVVYESMFGNTESVARAVAKGLEQWIATDIVEVGAAPIILGDDVRLLVAGSPTHAFGLPRASTRRDAAERTGNPLISSGTGLREWLSATGRPRPKVSAAAFDTKANKPLLPGSAAKAAHKRLHWLGFDMLVPPESFRVDGMTGPLADGELARARAWGTQVGTKWASGASTVHADL